MFQSARPVKGATICPVEHVPVACVSIRAPREGRDYELQFLVPQAAVSIRAPREGRDRIAVTFPPVS